MTVAVSMRDARVVSALAGIAWAYCDALSRSDYARASQTLIAFQTLYSQSWDAVASAYGGAPGAGVPRSVRVDGMFTPETRLALMAVLYKSGTFAAPALQTFPTSASAIVRWFREHQSLVPGTSTVREWSSLIGESSIHSVASNIAQVFEGVTVDGSVYRGDPGGAVAPAALPSGTLEAGNAASAAAQRELEEARAAMTTGGGAGTSQGSPFFIPGRTRVGSSPTLPWLLGIGGLAVFGFLVYWMVRRT